MSLKSSHTLTDQNYVNLVSWFHTWANTCLLYNTQWFNSNILIIIGPRIPISLHCNRRERSRWVAPAETRVALCKTDVNNDVFPELVALWLVEISATIWLVKSSVSTWIFDQSNAHAYFEQSERFSARKCIWRLQCVLLDISFWQIPKF